MSSLLLLDTHVLVWFTQGVRKIGKETIDLLEHASRNGHVTVSAISFWEVASLASRGRVSLPMSVQEWRRNVLDMNYAELAVTGEIAISAGLLEGLHGDSADRLILATAKIHGATLVTRDDGLLKWDGQVPRLDAAK